MLKQLKDQEEDDPKNLDKLKSENETLINAKKLYNNRDNVIRAFENGYQICLIIYYQNG